MWNIVLNVAQHGPENLLPLLDGVVDSWALLSSTGSANLSENSFVIPWSNKFELLLQDLTINHIGVRNMVSALNVARRRTTDSSGGSSDAGGEFVLKLLDSIPSDPVIDPRYYE